MNGPAITNQTSSSRPIPLGRAMVSGLLMGGADGIPGVSGGTIALVLGIYERFIAALSTVLKAPTLLRDPTGRSQIATALRLLFPLGLGMAMAYWLVTWLLIGKTADPGLMMREASAPCCYAFFFGLVLVSLKEPWRRIPGHRTSTWCVALAAFLVSVTFSGLPYARTEPETWMLLLGGAGAISVMLLPGVSGSLLLVMIGQYAAVVRAVHDLDMTRILVFALGIGIGLALFVPVLRNLLHRTHDHTMAALTGLMAGSLRALWPWKEQYDPKVGPLHNMGIGDDIPYVIVSAMAGAALVILLARLQRRSSS